MADLYVGDTTYATFVSAYGEEAKDEMRAVLKEAAEELDDG